MSKLRLGSDYIPLTTEEDMSKIRVVVPFSKVAWLTVSLPFLAFVFCVAYSVLYNFEHSTSTHCQVYNFLPSVSAAIGHYRPQRDIWKTAIALQAIIRTLVFMMYYRYYREHVYIWARYLSNIALVMYAIENTSLVTLSFWTSDESYTFHKMSFIMFLITSFIHMFLAYYIMRTCLNVAKDFHDTSLKWKRRSMMLNVSSILIACYFFYRHNKYCEPLANARTALGPSQISPVTLGVKCTPRNGNLGSGTGYTLVVQRCRLLSFKRRYSPRNGTILGLKSQPVITAKRSECKPAQMAEYGKLYFTSVLPSYFQECNKCRRVPLRCCALFDAWLGRSPSPR